MHMNKKTDTHTTHAFLSNNQLIRETATSIFFIYSVCRCCCCCCGIPAVPLFSPTLSLLFDIRIIITKFHLGVCMLGFCFNIYQYQNVPINANVYWRGQILISFGYFCFTLRIYGVSFTPKWFPVENFNHNFPERSVYII